MSHSEISICNLALAAVGEAPIRSFDESNKRSRMCDVFFDFARDLLLSKFDWPFARKYIELNQVDMTGIDVPLGEYVYQLPTDCITPRTIRALGSADSWRVVGNRIYTTISEDVFLYYTKRIADASLFSHTFVELLYLKLALQMCPALTADKKLVESLQNQYIYIQNESWESDANIGNTYREHDEDPDNDTFVNPDGVTYEDPNAGRTWP